MSTGHAHHFLSRLDRVSMPHVELALQLYRDHELVKFVLEHAKLPEGAPRVAIALERAPTSPHLVVTREGRFVTCLAEGMAFDLPVVSREKLDVLASRLEGLRTRLRVASELIGAKGGVGKMFARVHDAGNMLSREDMLLLGRLQPLVDVQLLRAMFDCSMDLLDGRAALLPQLKRASRLKVDLRPIAHAYWRSFWAIGHFAVLAAMSGPALLDKLSEDARESLFDTSISWGAVRQGCTGLALRGVWAAARIGKAQLGVHKRKFREDSNPLAVADSGMCLLALGARHSRLRAEARKTLDAGPSIPEQSPNGQVARAMAALLTAVADEDEASPEVQRERIVRVGADLAFSACEGLGRSSPYAFTRPEDVPEDLALSYLASLELPFVGAEGADRALAAMVSAVPWVARTGPADLYLPAAFLRETRKPWSPVETEMLLHMFRRRSPEPNPTQAASRQSPCSCGSGKKFKRCCGT